MEARLSLRFALLLSGAGVKRIDQRTVELTDAEMIASETFDGYLDIGYGILDAVAKTQEALGKDSFSDEFWEYLST